jgi:hypothetical protein
MIFGRLGEIMMADGADETYQRMLEMLLCDMSPPLGIIQGYAALLQEYLGQLAEQGQVATVIVNPDIEMTPQEALDMLQNLLKSVEKLEMLKHKTHDDIRNLLNQNKDR